MRSHRRRIDPIEPCRMIGGGRRPEANGADIQEAPAEARPQARADFPVLKFTGQGGRSKGLPPSASRDRHDSTSDSRRALSASAFARFSRSSFSFRCFSTALPIRFMRAALSFSRFCLSIICLSCIWRASRSLRAFSSRSRFSSYARSRAAASALARRLLLAKFVSLGAYLRVNVQRSLVLQRSLVVRSPRSVARRTRQGKNDAEKLLLDRDGSLEVVALALLVVAAVVVVVAQQVDPSSLLFLTAPSLARVVDVRWFVAADPLPAPRPLRLRTRSASHRRRRRRRRPPPRPTPAASADPPRRDPRRPGRAHPGHRRDAGENTSAFERIHGPRSSSATLLEETSCAWRSRRTSSCALMDPPSTAEKASLARDRTPERTRRSRSGRRDRRAAVAVTVSVRNSWRASAASSVANVRSPSSCHPGIFRTGPPFSRWYVSRSCRRVSTMRPETVATPSALSHASASIIKHSSLNLSTAPGMHMTHPVGDVTAGAGFPPERRARARTRTTRGVVGARSEPGLRLPGTPAHLVRRDRLRRGPAPSHATKQLLVDGRALRGSRRGRRRGRRGALSRERLRPLFGFDRRRILPTRRAPPPRTGTPRCARTSPRRTPRRPSWGKPAAEPRRSASPIPSLSRYRVTATREAAPRGFPARETPCRPRP